MVIKDYIAREFGEEEKECGYEIYWDKEDKKLRWTDFESYEVFSTSIPKFKDIDQIKQIIKTCEKEIKTVLGV